MWGQASDTSDAEQKAHAAAEHKAHPRIGTIGQVAIVQGSSLPPPAWPAGRRTLWNEWVTVLGLAQRFADEKLEAHEFCAAKHYMLAGQLMNLSWKQQKRCVGSRLNSTGGDRLRHTLLSSTGRPPVLAAAWRSVHAAINYAYAARHGYDIYFADVRGCTRNPSWCAKLCAYSLLFERWDEWVDRPTCASRALIIASQSLESADCTLPSAHPFT